MPTPDRAEEELGDLVINIIIRNKLVSADPSMPNLLIWKESASRIIGTNLFHSLVDIDGRPYFFTAKERVEKMAANLEDHQQECNFRYYGLPCDCGAMKKNVEILRSYAAERLEEAADDIDSRYWPNQKPKDGTPDMYVYGSLRRESGALRAMAEKERGHHEK